MVLGKVKYENVMGMVNHIHYVNTGNWTIVIHFDGTYRKELVFDNEKACKNAFDEIWSVLIRKGYCDLDLINKKTGMVMQ